ncbi:MAG: VOC family protein [Bdellovibrio sp.]|nr:VOC family protein [Bdellovibrio sp.]
MSRVMHFEIQADDPLRAINFYKNVFGWTFEKWNGPMEYWLIMTGEGLGIDGGLLKRTTNIEHRGNINAYVCTIDVSDVDEYVKKITANKGMIEMPKHAIPGVGWHAYAIDTEGNLFGILKNDRNVK